MSVQDTLDLLYKKAKEDDSLRQKLLSTRGQDNYVKKFCQISTEAGCPISAFDLIMAGEVSYAAMRRSTNGGGENSPLLQGEDDLYEMFLIELES